MSSISCFVWFVGMASLTAFFAWLAKWAMKSVNKYERPFAVAALATLAVLSFIGATAFLAGAIG
jgi:uncharacterized membrane protein (DUF485 family)